MDLAAMTTPRLNEVIRQQTALLNQLYEGAPTARKRLLIPTYHRRLDAAHAELDQRLAEAEVA